MLSLYGCAVLASAVLRGFNTPHDRAGGFIDFAHVVLVSLFWPVLLAAGFGHALRGFSTKRIAEDGGEPWVSRYGGDR